MTVYQDTQLFIDGEWGPGANGRVLPIVNPFTGETIGHVARAERADLDRALAAAQKGFQIWRNTSAFERAKVLRAVSELLRARVEAIAPILTKEQGKTIGEARIEVLAAAEIIDWYASEGPRAYGRVIPGRIPNVTQMVVREPIGVVAAFAPWNFPITQTVRKIAAAVATGCAIIAKAPEEAPGSPAAMVRAFADAGVPAGVVNLVYGDPAEISAYLIPHPIIRKVTFTGSTPVGKKLTAMAGEHMKRVTMELGGHAPAIVCADADIDHAVRMLAFGKFRNAGQVCVAPTRFLVQEGIFDQFVDKFTATAKALKVGDGMDPITTMGPLANPRRIEAMDAFVHDAVAKGAELVTGGKRIGNSGNLYEPTVLKNVPTSARVMNEEPFGPIALINPFEGLSDAITEANRLPYGLAAYAYSASARDMDTVARSVESGMISINHPGLALPETPFGGVKDSGYGSEGGTEGIDSYLNVKFISRI